MTADPAAEAEQRALESFQGALRLVCVTLPHLSGLAALVRFSVDRRVRTAGVFASGRLIVNPSWFCSLERADALFVVAHELLHLALRTHERAAGTDPRLFNIAHDYVINDLLFETLHQAVPAGGLWWPGARKMSPEAIAAELQQSHPRLAMFHSWAPYPTEHSRPVTALGAALQAAGVGQRPEPGQEPDTQAAGLGQRPEPGQEPDTQAGGLDVLPDELEHQLFPELDPAEAARARRRMAEAGARAAGLEVLARSFRKLHEAAGGQGRGHEAGHASALIDALRTRYRPPWQMALQRWMESVAPSVRTYARPSRRGAERADLVRVGRKREGWILHVVLDTSGSMGGVLERVLGVIAEFCEASNVDRVRVLQCDTRVTQDETLTPEQLLRFRVQGFGGSDLSPALERLAREPEVEAAVVLTDGFIGYPPEPMPYAVLWVLTWPNERFQPSYGQVLQLMLDNPWAPALP